jgi:hypothetical protein
VLQWFIPSTPRWVRPPHKGDSPFIASVFRIDFPVAREKSAGHCNARRRTVLRSLTPGIWRCIDSFRRLPLDLYFGDVRTYV